MPICITRLLITFRPLQLSVIPVKIRISLMHTKLLRPVLHNELYIGISFRSVFIVVCSDGVVVYISLGGMMANGIFKSCISILKLFKRGVAILYV